MPQVGKGGVDLARRAGMENKQFVAERACGLLRVACRARSFRKFRVRQQGDDRSVGKELVQQPQSLGAELSAEPAYPSHVATWPVEAGDIALLDGVATSQEHDRNRAG